MARVSKKQQPRFLWQALLILLPVAIMAAIGSVAVMRDRAAVEQQARERAREIAQQLASLLSQTLAIELTEFDAVAGDRYLDAHLGRGDTGADRARKWQQGHPEIILNENAPNTIAFSTDGSVAWPPEYDPAPKPAAWFVELSPEQRRLWDAIHQAQSATDQEQAIAGFLAMEPSRDARANLDFLLRGRSEPLAEGDRQVLSESGIPLGNLAFAQRGSDIWRDPNLDRHLHLLFDAPSVLIPELLRRLELDSGQNPEAAQNLSRIKKLWAGHERLRTVAAVLRKHVDLRNSAATNLWLEGAGDRWFCALSSRAPSSEPLPETRDSPAVADGHLNQARLYPVALVKSALVQGVAASPFAVPGYLQVTAALMSEPLYVGPVQETFTAAEVMASADAWVSGEAGTGALTQPPRLPDQPKLTVQVSLIDRPLLFRQQRQRTILFGALIAASVLAAVIGFLAAYRSFRRQLRLSEMKSNFVSSVSHELRAPIASVRLMAESLERGKISGPPKQQEYFRFISQECRRLSSLIENVLDFSRIDQGRKRYEFEPTDMAALVENSARLMEPYAAERGIRIGLRLPEHKSATIQAVVDSKAVQQALINLIDNAIKFSPKDQEVAVGLEFHANSPGVIRLWVEDRGVGIPSNEHERIFEQFYRLGSELRRESQGVGIGLSIVKHIVQAHGGRIEVRSAPGEGSRFTIELPAQPV